MDGRKTLSIIIKILCSYGIIAALNNNENNPTHWNLLNTLVGLIIVIIILTCVFLINKWHSNKKKRKG